MQITETDPLYLASNAAASDQEKRHLTERILRRVAPQAIFLIGSIQTARKVSALFMDGSLTVTHDSHFYLLVLIDAEDKKAAAAAQDKIESGSMELTPLTAMVIDTSTFFSWIAEGHRFAYQVVTKAERLHVADTLLFPLSPQLNNQERALDNKQVFASAEQMITAFLAGADLYRVRKEYKLSAFMLHQAVEQALNAILLLRMGYRAGTHNIDKLLRYASMVCPQFLDVFSETSEKDKKLLALLQKAYVHSRYKNEYTISFDEARQIAEKAFRMIQLFEQSKP